MWSDNESDLDLLGCSHLVKAVAGVIADEQLLPATIGIFGDWGSGKSSLMKMVELELSEKKDSLVLSFNGWLFEGYEDAKSALMDTILDEILKNRPLDEKAKEQLKKLVKRVNWMRVLGLLAKGAVALKTGGLAALGFGAAAAATTPALGPEDAKGLIKEEEEEEVRRGIREFRKDFGKLLKAARIETLVS